MGPVEESLKKLAEALEASYELVVDPATSNNGSAYSYVKFKGLRSKRYAVLSRTMLDGSTNHAKRFTYNLLTPAMTGEEMAAAREEAANLMLNILLSGKWTVKLSKTRRVRLPPASSVEELLLKMAVAGRSLR